MVVDLQLGFYWAGFEVVEGGIESFVTGSWLASCDGVYLSASCRSSCSSSHVSVRSGFRDAVVSGGGG
jgi:hypothetical protein